MNQDKIEFVSSIITNKNGNVLLLKRNNTLTLDPGKYDLCSGHMKNGEAPIQSMYRELGEETGIMPYEVNNIEKIGTIHTPHPKFKNTITHMYHIEINFTELEINEKIKLLQEPEMVKAKYIKNIDTLRQIVKRTEMMRTMYTEETNYILQCIQNKLNKRKELEIDICEEK